MKYIPLNVKTNSSLLDSMIKVKDLISFCLSNNISSVGVTDENLFSFMEMYEECKKNNIKFICGLEIKALGIICYAKNYDGYISLCKIIEEQNEKTFSYKDVSSYKNIIVVCKVNNYNECKDYFNELYIGYSSSKEKEEALILTKDVVYLNEVLCLQKEDNEYLTYLNHIKMKTTISEEGVVFNNHYIENNDEFDINTTIKFSALIDIKMPPTTLHIPVYKENSYEYLEALCVKGLKKRLNNEVNKEYKHRLLYELSIIKKMGFVDYFLIVYDFVLFAKKNNIMVGPGRGSAAGSLVSYSLGIVEVDPIKYGLIFERFLNPERVTMPDIDIDFDNTKRDEVIDYVKDKYGRDKVCNILAFDTFLPKLIIRDIGRVLNIREEKINALCRHINNEKTFKDLEKNKEFTLYVSRNSDFKKLVKICTKLCGLKKNTSIHAAGVVISDEKLSNIMPVYKKDDVLLSAFTMEYIEKLGLLKMDFLAISNLNKLSNIVEEINKTEEFSLNDIPLDDKKTLMLFSKGYTNGIFQFEKEGMKSFLKSLKVDSFNTLVDALALYRPGPKDMIGTYINRKLGKEKTTYLIKELEGILSSTYGIIIYQEQVLDILRLIGGYTYAQADIIRRAMSKKDKVVIEANKEKFINGVIKSGYTKEIGTTLYEQIIKFSNFGFNKSHSVVYALLSYQMAYLKAHYTSYFMSHLLNSTSSNEKIKEYIDESKIYKIDFESVSVNKSTDKFYLLDGKMIMPFTLIKNISNVISNYIIEERNKGKFKSFYDFMIRCYGSVVKKNIVISLVESGVFNEFNINKKMIINNIDRIINYTNLCKEMDSSLVSEPILERCDDYTDSETISNEIKNYGFYISSHPVTKIDRLKYTTLKSIENYLFKNIKIVLMIESIKDIFTKNGDKMCFVKLSDEYSKIEGVIFPKVYNKVTIEKGKIYLFITKVEKRNNDLQLIINDIKEIK